MNTTDWNDSQELSKYANNTIQLANKYHMSRKKWADAKFALDMILASKYANNTIERKIAYEKALLIIVSGGDKEIEEYYQIYVTEEANYKGFERVLRAHEGKISLSQSLIKNQVRNG